MSKYSSAYYKAWKEKYPEKVKEQQRKQDAQRAELRKLNPQKFHAKDRAADERRKVRDPERDKKKYWVWRAKNPIVLKSRLTEEERKEHRRLSSKKWLEAHRKEQSAASVRSAQKRRAQHPDEFRQYRRAHASFRRARKLTIPGQYTPRDIEKQLQVQQGRCFYCYLVLKKYHVDHKIPLCRGGSNGPENICCACPTCNLRKHAKTVREYVLSLRANDNCSGVS